MKARWAPGPYLLGLCALATPLFLFGGVGVALAVTAQGVLLLLALWERRGLAAADIEVRRGLEGRLLLGESNSVTLRLHNPTARRLRVVVRDDLPSSFEVDKDEVHAVLGPYERAAVGYSVRPTRRGVFALGDLDVRIEGPARLGSVLRRVSSAVEARVYPNLGGPQRFELAARLGALHSVGVRSQRRPGGAGEFEQMREYVAGDAYRDVDWKATAKRRRPIVRVNGEERSQTVVVALDAGRMMATLLDDLSKLDHAIHAALMLAYVALRSGDKVGLIVFAHGVLHFVPPRGGQPHYRRILDSVFAVEPSDTYVDFARLNEFLRVRVPRRSLLVLFSDLLDEAQAGPLVEQAGGLRRKHLPVCVTMADPVAERAAEQPVDDVASAYHRAAAADILHERAGLKARLRKSGIGLVEAPARELAVATVNRYLEIKSRRVL